MAFDDLKPLIEEGNKKIADIRSEIDTVKKADVVFEEKMTRMQADLAAQLKSEQDARMELKALEKRLAEIETKANRPGAPSNAQQVAEEHKAAFLEWARKGTNGGAQDRLFDLQQKAADVRTTVGASGGFALPKEIADQVMKQILDISPIRSIARVVQTGTTDYHQVVNRGGLAAEWVGEAGTRTLDTATPDYGDVSPAFGELSAVPSATRHSINDLFFDVEAELIRDGAERFAIAEGIAFISGTGTNQPAGFLTGTPVVTTDATRAFGTLQYRPTTAAGAFSANPFDQIIQLLYDLKAGYRDNATYVMNSLTQAALSVVRNTQGDYIMQRSPSLGQPDSIQGRPITVAEDMPVIAANSFSIAVGDFSRGYLIADIPGMWMVRDEITKVGWVRFPMAKRVGGRILDSNAIKLLRFAIS